MSAEALVPCAIVRCGLGRKLSSEMRHSGCCYPAARPFSKKRLSPTAALEFVEACYTGQR